MNGTWEPLRAALDRVRVTSPVAFDWDGERVALEPGSVDGLEPGETRMLLLARLEQRLYERFYLSGGRVDAPPPPPPLPWLSGLSAQLTAANRGRGRLEPGWRVLERQGDRVVVERGGLRVSARPDELAGEEDGLVRLRLPVDLPSTFPGFHCARGEQVERDESVGVDRLYWNLRPEGAVAFVRLATDELNAGRIPFGLKVVGDHRAFGRADAGVLVLSRRDRPAALPVVRGLLAALGDALDPPVPAFTKRLAPGLGFADAPRGGESFGTSRCRLVAEALVGAHARGLHRAEERAAAVRARFAEAGLDPGRAHLGPGVGADDDLDLEPIPRPRGRPRSEAPFLAVARDVGRRLCASALWHRDRCTWLAEVPAEGAGGRVVVDLGPTLLDGTGGVGLFLTELARRTGDEAARRTALGALHQALARRSAVPEEQRGGLFTGWVGIALAAAHGGRALDDPALLERAAVLAREAPDPPGDDLLRGRAGAVAGLLALDRLLPDQDLSGRAHRLAAALASEVAAMTPRAPAGAAKGLAGVHEAVAAAAGATGDPALAAAADQLAAALSARSEATGISWCDGLSGIVTALRGPATEPALDALCAELRAAVADRAPDLSLFSGLLGAADVLVRVAGGRPSRGAELRGLAAAAGEVAASTYRHPDNTEGPPGLMLGLAGVGLGCLRLHDPRTVSPLAISVSWPAARPVVHPVRRPA